MPLLDCAAAVDVDGARLVAVAVPLNTAEEEVVGAEAEAVVDAILLVEA